MSLVFFRGRLLLSIQLVCNKFDNPSIDFILHIIGICHIIEHKHEQRKIKTTTKTEIKAAMVSTVYNVFAHDCAVQQCSMATLCLLFACTHMNTDNNNNNSNSDNNK